MTIVEELRTDRESGARRLESEYKAGLMTLARRFCADEGDAEELVNRTLAAVVEGIDDYLEQSAFFGWMCKILENLHAKDVRRKSSRTVAGDAEAVDGARDDEAGDRIFREVDASLLRDAIAELPADMKDVLMLRYFMDLPVSRVARILSAPEGTVKWRLHCARMVLAAKLGAATRRPGARLVLLALLFAAGLAVGRGVYALASAALSSRAESAEVAESPVSTASTASTASTVSTSSTVPTVSTASTVPTPEPPAMNAKPFLAATASLALAAAPAPVRAAGRPCSVTFAVAGYAGSSTLTNFPVLVRIVPDSTNKFDYALCAADGSDIRFADDAGNLIPHEIDTWNTAGESAIWVALPEMSARTEFSMLYGPNAPAESASGTVWAGAGYKSVWHLNFSGSTTHDSVVSYTGTIYDPAAVLACAGEGVVGEAYHCESNGGPHYVGTSAVEGFTQSSDGKATFSAWFRQIGGTMQNGKPDPENYPKITWNSQYGNCGVIVNSKNGQIETGNGVEIGLSGWANDLNALVVRDSVEHKKFLDTESLYDKQWHHVAVTWDGTTRTLYLDGVLQPVMTASAVYRTPTGTVRFGARSLNSTASVWTGELDEFRFLPSAASADWIAAEHAQVSSDSFLKVLRLSGTVIIVR